MVDFSIKLKEVNVSDFFYVIKVVNRLKDMKFIVCFFKLENFYIDWKMVVFIDVFFGNFNDGVGSIGVYVLWIKDRKGNCCFIVW